MTGGRAIGAYRAVLPEDATDAQWSDWLAALPLRVAEGGQVLSEGRNRVVRFAGEPLFGGGDIVVKRFGRQSAWKDRLDRRQGSKAERSWGTAVHMAAHAVGTPAPLGFANRWAGGRLVESYLVTRWVSDATNLRSELLHIYLEEPRCADLMALLEVVARAARALHDAGVIHRDLGNQNILLAPPPANGDRGVLFLDLNRARVKAGVDEAARARDLSRLDLPSDMLRVFFEMYWGGPPGNPFRRIQARARRRYAWHERTRQWRHPFRERHRAPDPHPAPRDIWIWDDRSVQAVSVLLRADRARLRSKASAVRAGVATVRALPAVWPRYRDLLANAYRQPVSMGGRVGMAVEPPANAVDEELAWLADLGRIPVLLRIYHHTNAACRDRTVALAGRLHGAGHEVSLALVQDRRAVKDPASWGGLLRDVLAEVHGFVSEVEVGHAINRVKWGVWSWREYARFMAPAAEVMAQYPAVHWMGPACIDFEYLHVAAALDSLPAGLHFQALSHHLYVDRRGAPENRQGCFSTLEKAALARALAGASPRCDDRLVVSEVNWPLLGTGVYSPVVSPHDTPGPRVNNPSVSEQDYARFMIRYLLITLCSGMADRVFWWRLAARGFGLIDDTDPARWRPRAAYWMLKDFQGCVGESRFVARHAGAGAHYFLFENSEGSGRAVGYAERTDAVWAPPFTHGGARALATTADPAGGGLRGWPADGSPVIFEDVVPAGTES